MHTESTAFKGVAPPSFQVPSILSAVERTIDDRSPLYALISTLRSFDPSAIPADLRESYDLMAWGPTSRNSRATARQLRVLLGAPWLRLATSKGTQLEALGLEGVAQEWCRLFNRGIDPGIAGILHDLGLSAEPERAFVGLDYSMLDFCERATPDPKTQAQFFACLSRIAAYQCNGEVRWHSQWLKGSKANPRAIKGATSNRPMLHALLMTHVLQKVGGQRFSKAATYKLKLEIKTGSLGHIEAAELLNVKWRRCKKLGKDPMQFSLGAYK